MQPLPPPHRFTLRDLPLPAKWVLSLFLMAIGLGYVAAMMQLHMKSGSHDGNPLPTVKDVVKRYSGADWPLNGKGEAKQAKPEPKQADKPDVLKKEEPAPTEFAASGIKIRSLLTVRCAECHHPEGEKDDVLLHEWEKLAEHLKPAPETSKVHVVLTGPADSWSEKSMVQAFTNKSVVGDTEWKKAFPKLNPGEQAKLLRERETERLAMIAWLKAGAKKEHYDADLFPLPDELAKRSMSSEFGVGLAPIGGAKAEEKKVAEAPAASDGPLTIKLGMLVSLRCAECHKKDKPEVPLNSVDDLTPLLLPTPTEGKLYKVLTGSPTRWGDDSMVRAFTDKSDNWKELLKHQGDKLKAERENERLALLAWLEAGAPPEAFRDNEFVVPAGKLKGSEFTKTLIVGEDNPSLPARQIQQIDLEKLIMSTHAHMLTFAMMWTLTGLIFAFTSYPLWMRLMIAPAVLLAQIVDVLCWWLARLPDVGPYFAVAILGTGAIVGMGIGAQIILSLFNMYSSKGKMTLAFLFLFGFGGLGVFFIKCVEPELAIEKKEAAPAAPK
jgi:hypothetical protein